MNRDGGKNFLPHIYAQHQMKTSPSTDKVQGTDQKMGHYLE